MLFQLCAAVDRRIRKASKGQVGLPAFILEHFFEPQLLNQFSWSGLTKNQGDAKFCFRNSKFCRYMVSSCLQYGRLTAEKESGFENVIRTYFCNVGRVLKSRDPDYVPVEKRITDEQHEFRRSRELVRKGNFADTIADRKIAAKRSAEYSRSPSQSPIRPVAPPAYRPVAVPRQRQAASPPPSYRARPHTPKSPQIGLRDYYEYNPYPQPYTSSATSSMPIRYSAQTLHSPGRYSAQTVQPRYSAETGHQRPVSTPSAVRYGLGGSTGNHGQRTIKKVITKPTSFIQAINLDSNDDDDSGAED